MAEKTEKNDVNLPLIFTIGISGTLITVVLVLVAQALFGWQSREEEARQIDRLRPSEYVQARLQQDQTIRTLGWVDNPQSRRVRVDIDRAMQIVARNGGMLPTTRPGS